MLLGTLSLDHNVLRVAYEDQITPIGPSVKIGTDGYEVLFIASPMEAYGTAAQKVDLMTRVFSYFGP